MQPVFSPIDYVNTQLNNLLDGEQQDKSRTYFKLSWIDDNNLSPDFLAGLEGESLDHAIRVRIALRQMSKFAANQSERDVYHRQISPNALKIEKSTIDQATGFLSLQGGMEQVLIEWRRHGSSSDEAVSQEMFVRMEALSDLLAIEKPPELRALECLGFYLNDSSCAFRMIFKIPKFPNVLSMEPTNLHELMLKTSKVKLQPALESKFKLAHTLARSVLEFHMVGWLHKQLKSSNIAFFPETGSLIDNLVVAPYIIGFNHSRPDEPYAFTEGFQTSEDKIYHHPTNLKGTTRYQPEFDYYSLGLVLLEIGLWKPLKSLVGDLVDLSADDLRKTLLSSRVPLLGQTMGKMYRNVVKACIRGEFAWPDKAGGAQNDVKASCIGFEHTVVIPLKRCWTGIDCNLASEDGGPS
jgi:hypothetical protein